MSFDLQVNPSTLEVDYDKNLTDLYKAITDQNWERAVEVCKSDPVQAATWVVRHYEESDNDESELEIMWRFLPIHSACARQPPAAVVAALVKAYPDGPRCIDDQGMYALHYACGNQASRDVIRQLLVSCPEAARLPDPRGMLPIHYLACWGPSSVALVDMMLVSNRDVALVRDDEGNTPMDLAMEGEYPEKDAVIEVLRRWLGEDSLFDLASQDETSKAESKASIPQRSMKKPPKSSASSVGSISLQEMQEEKREDTSMSNSLVSTGGSTTSTLSKRRLLAQQELVKKTRDFVGKKSTDMSPVKSSSRALPRASSTESSAWKFKAMEYETEVLQLKEQLSQMKDDYEQKLSHQKKKYEEKLTERAMEVEESRDLAESARNEAHKHKERSAPMENELAQALEKLKASNNERDGLRSTLGDLMEQHEAFKKKSVNMNDRLGSLSAGLDSMLEQQSFLRKSMEERNASVSKCYENRKSLLGNLLELENVIVKDEDKLNAALEKQTRELDAISAVIKAARE